ncbi:DUF5672 family protein [Lutibacter sp. TH_r2]|uniref:DUF5672 family protein n=1 Tax=Lutibacter sp. TH_r2 TaxID=3082083 RepID=UPI0029555ECE|nr:DUF5672 family protein [Lutibacter sp. TH_r2]MDV7187440.1 DUF5672 family protein [Lutibacter sp. TH_r2]
MIKKEICIVIPIYKETLNKFEIISILQCIKVLSNYNIHFVCSKKLNIKFYKSKFKEITNYTFFEEEYFANIEGYNSLMLSANFYKTFENYSYMLLYQTDCYVIKDELLAWANKGYDYIGGVWFENYRGNPNLGAKEWFPGNGGLSLRNIKTVIKLVSSKAPLKNMKQLNEEKNKLKNKANFNIYKWFFSFPFRLMGYKNNLNYLAQNYKANEDVFFMQASLIYKKIKTPNVNQAILFSWDRHPAFLYNKYKKLPFACHAWYRSEIPYEGNKEFWMSVIKK